MSTVQKINVRFLASQRGTLQYVTLDDVQIGLRFRHSALIDRWYLWLIDTAGNQIAGPIKLVPGINLWQAYQYDERVPPGQLFVQGDPPTKTTVDKTSTLRYREIANVTA